MLAPSGRATHKPSKEHILATAACLYKRRFGLLKKSQLMKGCPKAAIHHSIILKIVASITAAARTRHAHCPLLHILLSTQVMEGLWNR